MSAGGFECNCRPPGHHFPCVFVEAYGYVWTGGWPMANEVKMPMTPTDLDRKAEELAGDGALHRAEHLPFADIQFIQLPKCVRCLQVWPCPTSQRVALIRATLGEMRDRFRREEEAHAALQLRCFEGFPSVSDGIFDAVREMQEEIERLKAKVTRGDSWENGRAEGIEACVAATGYTYLRSLIETK